MTWVGGISLFFKFAGIVLKVLGAREETKKKFLEMVETHKHESAVAVQAYDKFKEQQQQIQEEMKPKEEVPPSVEP